MRENRKEKSATGGKRVSIWVKPCSRNPERISAHTLDETFVRGYHMARKRICAESKRYFRDLKWQDEEDIFQEAAVRIWSRLAEGSLFLKNEEHCANLLKKASQNVRIDSWRKDTQSGKVMLYPLSTFEVELAWPVETTSGFELGELLGCLAPAEKRLLFARIVLGMSWKEISRAMGTTELAVRTRFCRIRKKLAEALEHEQLGAAGSGDH